MRTREEVVDDLLVLAALAALIVAVEAGSGVAVEQLFAFTGQLGIVLDAGQAGDVVGERVDLPGLDQPDHPARIQVHTERNPAPHLGQVFDGQAQPPRSGGAQHQPVGAAREALFAERLAEHGIVDAEVVHVDPRLGNARAAAGLEDVDRPVGVGPRDPAPHRPAPQPLVLKRRKPRQIVEAVNFPARVPSQLPGVVQPERRAGLGIEMPSHHGPDPLIQPLAGLRYAGCQVGRACRRLLLLHGHAPQFTLSGSHWADRWIAYSFSRVVTYSKPLAATGVVYTEPPMSIVFKTFFSRPA